MDKILLSFEVPPLQEIKNWFAAGLTRQQISTLLVQAINFKLYIAELTRRRKISTQIVYAIQ